MLLKDFFIGLGPAFGLWRFVAGLVHVPLRPEASSTFRRLRQAKGFYPSDFWYRIYISYIDDYQAWLNDFI